ncbi:response regulator transcription factor [Marinilactibacillus kalidii]|uniref:response regulator transcription factor n=1 Tax=Marinilactibacillus kalidii TaxID=2820274 RepID=UPI001FC9854B|nr:response regulator transcription factor [Marinilactibacillus kalidii]
MIKIMIVEDDQTIAQTLQAELEKWQYEAFYVTDFQNVLERYTVEQPQLVLMDINLPAFNGYHWTQEIRKLSGVPIIFISSRTDEMDMVMAIQMGADDFIQKPFSLTVVIAKVQAMLRRTYDYAERENYLTVDDVILKPAESTITSDNQTIELTKNENQILELLFRNKGTYVTRETIITRLWESESFIDDNTLAVNISRLRKKFKTLDKTDFIKTKKGAGYGV